MILPFLYKCCHTVFAYTVLYISNIYFYFKTYYFSDGKLHDVEISVGGGGKIVSVRENGKGGKIYQVGKYTRWENIPGRKIYQVGYTTVSMMGWIREHALNGKIYQVGKNTAWAN
jgi:hypothetical protein